MPSRMLGVKKKILEMAVRFPACLTSWLWWALLVSTLHNIIVSVTDMDFVSGSRKISLCFLLWEKWNLPIFVTISMHSHIEIRP
jgi:hypothetical protein